MRRQFNSAIIGSMIATTGIGCAQPTQSGSLSALIEKDDASFRIMGWVSTEIYYTPVSYRPYTFGASESVKVIPPPKSGEVAKGQLEEAAVLLPFLEESIATLSIAQMPRYPATVSFIVPDITDKTKQPVIIPAAVTIDAPPTATGSFYLR